LPRPKWSFDSADRLTRLRRRTPYPLMVHFTVGIDLGTTHCALSFLDGNSHPQTACEQSILSIPQLTALGTVEERQLLPSFLYVPNADEFPARSLALPWNSEIPYVVGEWARAHGSQVPSRLVASAKSWLSHPGIDPNAPSLPWQAPAEVPKVSAVDAAVRFLEHLRDAWNHRFADNRPDSDQSLARQDLVLTVPASFDAAASELTRQAAMRAGLPNVILLEEPQAALYAWIQAMGDQFRKEVSPGDVILVVDVGGGTTDFSLIAVGERDGELELTRVAVGDHILLGGDNMDLTLAHVVQQRLAAGGRKLDAWQFQALVHGCRQAKETLFNSTELDRAPIAIPHRGSTLIGKTIKTDLARTELETVLTDGFFPIVSVTDSPRTTRRTGLAQMALPYAQDPGVTRHLAAFLSRQARTLAASADAPIDAGGGSFIKPTAVLFNGGVFKANALKVRLRDVLNAWLTDQGAPPARELLGANLDLAVARGAAYYGWVRQGHGLRIRGGTARAYYVGVESAAPAVPGFEPPLKALCLAPFGMEEGTEAAIPPQQFGLVVGEPTRFRFFASSTRRDDRAGDLLDDVTLGDELEELAPIETSLPGEGRETGSLVPVHLQAAVTEVGTLELRCLEQEGAGRWKLEFNVRPRDD
jgi:molecular chaperone DnaK (HSP70)